MFVSLRAATIFSFPNTPGGKAGGGEQSLPHKTKIAPCRSRLSLRRSRAVPPKMSKVQVTECATYFSLVGSERHGLSYATAALTRDPDSSAYT